MGRFGMEVMLEVPEGATPALRGYMEIPALFVGDSIRVIHPDGFLLEPEIVGFDDVHATDEELIARFGVETGGRELVLKR